MKQTIADVKETPELKEMGECNAESWNGLELREHLERWLRKGINRVGVKSKP